MPDSSMRHTWFHIVCLDDKISTPTAWVNNAAGPQFQQTVGKFQTKNAKYAKFSTRIEIRRDLPGDRQLSTHAPARTAKIAPLVVDLFESRKTASVQ